MKIGTASLAEINPLVMLKDGSLKAIDAKMTFDDNALFRHPDVAELFEPTEEERKERDAKEKGFSYVNLGGSIGCMVNGAGLAMATMDMIKLYGGEPANFLDIGGSSNPEKIVEAMKLLLSDKHVKVVLINIFGGITRCDDVANGLLEAFKVIETDIYGQMLEELRDLFYPKVLSYYYDLTFEETVRRHQTRSKKADFSPADMKRWWKECDFLLLV